MNFPGLSESVIHLVDQAVACPVCGSEATVHGGACVRCLLCAGLEETEGGNLEQFEAALAAIDVPDTDWRLGNYQVLEEIGRGGMGVIYRARQRYSKRTVALKRVLSYHGDSRETLERFRREAEAAASLDHPNILPIYEVGESDGLPFFTMKLASGGSLQQAAPALRRDTHECVRLLAKVTRAVSHAHRAGLLHRDLKPGNILLDSSGEPLVSDFGLAKWMDVNSDLTRSLAVFGTPGFIAPEQASGDRSTLGPPADIYSLGAILFDLLAGRPPFLGEHAIAVIRQAAEKAAPKLRSIIPGADRDLETICAKCLEREPQARYRSASDLADDLERWLGGLPILARPISLPAELWRWSKRNPLLATAAIACSLAGTMVTAQQIKNWRFERTLTTQAAWQHSILVLPFLDLDSAEWRRDWSQGLAVELEQGLKSLGPAVIRAGTEDDHPRQVENGTDSPVRLRTFLSGTLRTKDGKLRVCLLLTEAKSNETVVQRTLESDPAGALRAVAQAFSGELYSTLSVADLSGVATPRADPGLLDPETQNYITAGLDLGSRRNDVDIERGIGCLRRAVELQGKSSAAHAALAKLLGYKVGLTGNRESLPASIESAQKAIALDPASSEAHLALAGALFHAGRFRAALEETMVALENGTSSRRAASIAGTVFKLSGRPDKALAWMAIARKGEKGPRENEAGLGDCWAYLGDDARAESAYKRHLSLHPDQPEGWLGLCRLRLLNHQIEEARRLYQQQGRSYAGFSYFGQMAAQVEFFARNFAEAEKMYEELYGRDPMGGHSFYGSVSYASALGRIRLAQDPAAAFDLLTNARAAEMELLAAGDEDPKTMYRLAAIEASLGHKEAATERLQQAVTAGLLDYRSLAMDPRFDHIREEPIYRQVIETLTAKEASLRAGLGTKSREN